MSQGELLIIGLQLFLWGATTLQLKHMRKKIDDLVSRKTHIRL